MWSILLQPRVMANILAAILSGLVGAGYVKEGAVTSDQLLALASGIAAFISIGNAVFHARDHMAAREELPMPPSAGADAAAGNSSDKPNDMGGA